MLLCPVLVMTPSRSSSLILRLTVSGLKCMLAEISSSLMTIVSERAYLLCLSRNPAILAFGSSVASRRTRSFAARSFWLRSLITLSDTWGSSIIDSISCLGILQQSVVSRQTASYEYSLPSMKIPSHMISPAQKIPTISSLPSLS